MRREEKRLTPHTSRLCSFFEYSNRWKLLALEKLEERPTPRRYVGYLIGDAVLGNGRQRVTTAGERERFAAGDGTCQVLGTVGEWLKLEHSHRAS